MIILNELEYADSCIKNNDMGENPYTTLSILSKYYYHHLGYKKKQIILELTEFIAKNYPKYQLNKSNWDESIEKLASNAKKFQLHEIDGVWITKAEMQSIQDIHNKVLERLTFTMLCLAKLAIRKNGNANGWINEDAKTIFSLARVSGSVLDRNIRIGQLADIGILELPKKNDSLSVRLTIVDDESDNELFVHDFRELGYEYLKYCGENITRCPECKLLFRNRKKNPWTYCPICSPRDKKHKTMDKKKIICLDCGKIVEIDSKDNQTQRCYDCYETYRAKRKLETQRIRRASQKMKSAQIES